MTSNSLSASNTAEATLLPDEVTQRRFGGLERLYGVGGAQRIRDAHVVVVGVGGVGSWTAEALARSGVGQLTLVDLDHVAESNINRQIHAVSTTVGQAKVLAMRDRIALINPGCVVHCIEDFVEPENWPELLGGVKVSAVVDACDQVRAKTAMAAWALANKQLLISVGAAGASAKPTRWISMTCLPRRMTLCWRSFVTASENTTVLHETVKNRCLLRF